MIVTGYDDWHGLFVDDVLMAEGHSIQIWELVYVSNGQPFTLEQWSEPDGMADYLAEHGCFAHGTLTEVKQWLDTFTGG